MAYQSNSVVLSVERKAMTVTGNDPSWAQASLSELIIIRTEYAIGLRGDG